MPTAPDYQIKDLALADWGRKEMAIAETEMPGLMAIRREYGPSTANQRTLRSAPPTTTPTAPRAASPT